MRSSQIGRVIIYHLNNSDQTLVITDGVLAHFSRHQQLTNCSREAGGQLFAQFDGPCIRIEYATGPRRTDRRGRRFFVPNRRAERREIKRLFKKGLYYIGDWHSHPELQPTPSQIDIWNVKDTFLKSRHGLAGFVLVIVGKASFPYGLFVSVCNKNGLTKLVNHRSV